MSDFVSDFWSYYVALATIAGIVFCGVILYVMGRRRAPSAGAPAAGGTPGTTGHVWDDDLAEYNNPLPRWWMWMFWITIGFGLVYLVLYPGFGKLPGILGWTSAGSYAKETKEFDDRLQPLFAKYLAMDVKDLANDREAHSMGERLFLNYCSQCHGSDAHGGRGFPNLSQGEFLYGRDPAQIKTTITGGRLGVMPAFGPVLGEEKLGEVVAYVRSLSGLPSDPLKAQLGKQVFMTTCVACHGPEAKGNPVIGAPNLTDQNWLYGSSQATITETVRKGRHTSVSPGTLAMPSFKDTLGEGRIHLLTAYVWSLSKPNVTTTAAR
ncbi:MAG TPA: cytochrome-c oxidase, cbb3-type subunit III [Casimicrobiaceae bacterium]|nr:cytochrome-c oxidase, cbb3-type subunit III [Casimicrobiaceae bacterium]